MTTVRRLTLLRCHVCGLRLGLGAVSDRSAQDERRCCGKSVWFWHPWLVSSWRRFSQAQPGSQNRQSGSDGGKRNSSPGRARHKPSNHCAGKAGCSPLDLYARVRTSLCHCTRDRGCSAHPVFPAPSHVRGGKRAGTTRARRAARIRRHIRPSDLIRFPPIIIPT
jgi:hypothetical protein